jgi:hypothetical protein
MKLCRYGRNGFEKPGMIDGQGQLRDLSSLLPNIDQETISPKGLTRLRKIRAESLPLVRTNPRFGVPYTGITKFVAIGLNYIDHARETGAQIPPEPIIFMKATTSISGPNDDIVTPKNSTKLDYDKRFEFLRPASFPMTRRYEVDSWNEDWEEVENAENPLPSGNLAQSQ